MTHTVGLQTIVRQFISRENVWKLQLITFMTAHSKQQIFLCALRCMYVCIHKCGHRSTPYELCGPPVGLS